MLANQRLEFAKLFGNGFRRPGEPAVGRHPDRANIAAKCIEQGRHYHAARAVAAVQRNPEAPGANGIHVHHVEREDRINVPAYSIRIRAEVPKFIPVDVGNPAARGLAHGCGVSRGEKQAVGSYELERVPLDRVVAGRDREATGGVMMLHRQLNGGRRCHSDVYRIAAHALEGGDDHTMKERSGDAAVPADHHGA